MGKFYMILSLVILLLVAVFALTNSQDVTVNLLGLGKWESNTAMIILVSFAAGAVLMAIFDLGRSIRSWKENRNQKVEFKAIAEERDALRRRVNELSRNQPTGNDAPEKDLPNP